MLATEGRGWEGCLVYFYIIHSFHRATSWRGALGKEAVALLEGACRSRQPGWSRAQELLCSYHAGLINAQLFQKP